MPKTKTAPAAETAEPKKPEQVSFLTIDADLAPIKRIAVASIDVPGAKEPDEIFVKSIEATGGAEEPVIVIANQTGGRYRLIEGRRRVLAHKRLIAGDNGKKFESIDARVYAAGSLSAVEIAVLTLRTNAHRSANPIAELQAIQQIERSGIKDTKKIADLVGMSVRQVQRLKRLEMLVPDLRTALSEGRMTLDTALKATKLSKDEQAEIVETADEETGQISGATIGEALQVGPAKGLDKLFTMDLRPTTASRLSAVITELQQIMAAADNDDDIKRIGAALAALDVVATN